MPNVCYRICIYIYIYNVYIYIYIYEHGCTDLNIEEFPLLAVIVILTARNQELADLTELCISSWTKKLHLTYAYIMYV